jgi:geranylgeranyl diphosphate synthase, type I
VTVGPAPALPLSVTSVASRVNRRLEVLLDEEIGRWADVDPDLAAPLRSLRLHLLSGGKRLRPAFCYWSYVGAGGDPSNPAVVDAGAALEMLHTAALMHDDIIDGSLRRHGIDTVHTDYAARHRTGSWSGHPERFGEAVAIILGDLALVYSDRLMLGAGTQAEAVFDEMRLEVNIGQYLDILGAAQGVGLPGSAAVDRARRICQYKTAKYTVERPLHLGAALAAPERLDELAGPLSGFGLPLGEAFQLRDDLLGVFGDPGVTGKPVGDDLREGKPTLLASLAARAESDAGGDTFETRFGAPDLQQAEIARLQELIEWSGARAEVESTISRLVETATTALESLPLRADAITALGELAAFVAGRDR